MASDGFDRESDPLRDAAREHRHDNLDIVTVPKGRALFCHECQRPVAEDRGVNNRGA